MTSQTNAETGMPPAPDALSLPVAMSLPAGTSDEDVAALVAVLLSGAPADEAAPAPSVSGWSDRARGIRHDPGRGNGAWRASGLPR